MQRIYRWKVILFFKRSIIFPCTESNISAQDPINFDADPDPRSALKKKDPDPDPGYFFIIY